MRVLNVLLLLVLKTYCNSALILIVLQYHLRGTSLYVLGPADAV